MILTALHRLRFSTLLDIDKLTRRAAKMARRKVLVLCWILINLHRISEIYDFGTVLVLCWILINLHPVPTTNLQTPGFSTLLDIDKLTQA